MSNGLGIQQSVDRVARMIKESDFAPRAIVRGLLPPAGGELLVDDHALSPAEFTAWRRRCGYVPQEIFLADRSVRANIAFGIPEKQIDDSQVERAARIANTHDFVSAELTEGYNTVVGERGVRLSGGYRRRIGIARALYHDPDILVMDEATSALDSITETAVMDAICALMHTKRPLL